MVTVDYAEPPFFQWVRDFPRRARKFSRLTQAKFVIAT